MPLTRYAESYPVYARIALTNALGTQAVQSTPSVEVPHRFDMVLAISTSVTDHDVRLEAYVAAVGYILGTVSVPAGAGYGVVPAVDLVAALIAAPNDGVVLPAGANLRGACAASLASGETLTLVCVGGTV